ncbi:hypothetical protein BH10BAC3_BH10BAC3_11940 [soil metagenome]
MNANYNKNRVDAPINSGGHVIIGDGNTISIVQQTETVIQLTFSAKNLIKNKAYSNAREILNKLLSKIFDNGDLYYYLSLSIIAGRRPKTLGTTDVTEIIRNIDLAIAYDKSMSHYFYLKAIMLYDFYYLNGFSVDISKINELLTAAANGKLERSLIEEMLNHIPGADKEILDCIIFE